MLGHLGQCDTLSHMKACLCCSHVSKAQIDDALTQGQSVRKVAATFAVSKSGVSRHLSGCLRPMVAAAAKAVQAPADVRAPVQRAKAINAGTATPTPTEVLSLGGLLERVARSLERLETAADGAAASDLYVPLAGLSGQLHRAIETAAKLQGIGNEPPVPDRERFSVTINFPEGFSPPAVTLEARERAPISAEYRVRDALLDATPDALPAEEGAQEEDGPRAFEVPGFGLA